MEPDRCPVRPSNMARFTFLMLLLFAVGLAACEDGGQEGDATPGPQEREAVATPATTATVPELVRPPDLLVTAGESEVLAGVGTFCWGSVCADTFAPITSTDVLVAEGQPTIDATLQPVPSGKPIESARVTALRIDQQPGCDPQEPVSVACGALLPVLEDQQVAWPSASADSIMLPVSIQEGGLRVTPMLEPGTYIVLLSLFFEGGGDVAYGVLLRVAED